MERNQRGRDGTDVLPVPSSADTFGSEHRELPGVGSLFVADEIHTPVCAFQLEISVVGRQPGVEYLRDGYPMVTKNQLAWRLLAAMACVALDTDAEQPLFRHLIHRTTLARS
jgi:hypothetical protein